MKITKTKLEGVVIIEPDVFGDNRGFFMESWNKKKMAEAGLDYDFVQDNHSKSTVKPPKDAPDFFKTYGKFANIAREEKIGTFKSKGNRETDFYLPFKNQPIQGHSGIKYIPKKDVFWVISDNGLGKKYNSYDAMLYAHEFKFDFKNSTLFAASTRTNCTLFSSPKSSFAMRLAKAIS